MFGENATLADLRKEVCAARSLHVSSFALLLDADELRSCKDEAPLSECRITDNATLTLVRKTSPEVLTASVDRTVKIWDCYTGACKHTLSGHADRPLGHTDPLSLRDLCDQSSKLVDSFFAASVCLNWLALSERTSGDLWRNN